MNTIQTRYEIGHPDYGVIEHVSSKRAVIEKAKQFCRKNNVVCVEVFDRMARIGETELWLVFGRNDKTSWLPVQSRMQTQ